MDRKAWQRGIVWGAVLVASFLGWGTLHAQEYPTKPITLLYGSSPGGSHDLTFRAVTSVAQKYLGQPIVIETKSGGGGAIATELTAKAKPDGYTLLVGGPGWNTTLPAVEGRSKGPDDLIGVCRINYSPVILVARPDAPYKTFKEMLDWARANPGKLIYGSTGTWKTTDLAWRLILLETGIDTKNIPYEGGSKGVMALLGGHIDVHGVFPPTIISHVKAGKVRPLLILDEKRHPDFPDVPMGKEVGIKTVVYNWRGVMAPKGTPRPIVDKLAQAFKKMTEEKSVIATIEGFGDDVQFLGPDEFNKFWRDEYNAQKEIAKKFK